MFLLLCCLSKFNQEYDDDITQRRDEQ